LHEWNICYLSNQIYLYFSLSRCIEGGAEEYMIKPLKVSDVPRILSYMWRAKGIPWIKTECKPVVLYQSCLCVTLYGLVILSSIVFEPFVITIRLFLCHVVFCGWNPCHSFSSDKLNIMFHLNILFFCKTWQETME
jgi:hypothetical protein